MQHSRTTTQAVSWLAEALMEAKGLTECQALDLAKAYADRSELVDKLAVWIRAGIRLARRLHEFADEVTALPGADAEDKARAARYADLQALLAEIDPSTWPA